MDKQTAGDKMKIYEAGEEIRIGAVYIGKDGKLYNSLKPKPKEQDYKSALVTNKTIPPVGN